MHSVISFQEVAAILAAYDDAQAAAAGPANVDLEGLTEEDSCEETPLAEKNPDVVDKEILMAEAPTPLNNPYVVSEDVIPMVEAPMALSDPAIANEAILTEKASPMTLNNSDVVV
jgi:hypothetical protein